MKCLRRLVPSQAKDRVNNLTPNLALNADVPHAGLRPRSGPPVSLFR
jgi:hypothetical protein